MESAGNGASTVESPPRRVLMIVQNLPVPFDRRVWMEAKTLRAAGYEVAVICPRGKFATQAYEFLDGIHIYRHPLPVEAVGKFAYIAEYGTAMTWEFFYAFRVLRRHGFDVIHACNPPDLIYLVAMIFKTWFGKKFVFDHHDLCPELYEAKFGKASKMYQLLLFLERRTFRFADISIATNNSYRCVAIDRGGMEPERVFTVRSGPNIDFVRPRPPNDKWKNGRAYLVAYVGVIGDQEGLDLLVEAVEHIVRVRGRTDIQTVVMGSGPAWESLNTQTQRLNLTDYITLTGRVDDDTLFTVLSTADVCVNPDRPNPMNDMSTMNKIMEYMAMGKPIVQFDLKEGRVSAAEASLYARNTDVDDFAAKMLELIDDPERRARMGAFGLERVRNELSWEQEAPKLLAAYDALYALPPRTYRTASASPGKLFGLSVERIENLGRRARARLPQRLILHPDYFLVRTLCASAEAGDTDAYMPIVRERLRAVLTEAVTHVPHYQRGRITQAQCHNENPFELIGEFPLLTKGEIAADPNQFVSQRVPRFMRYQKASSGSSGQGIVLWRTKRTADVEKAFLDNLWKHWDWSAAHSRILRMGDDSRRKMNEYPVCYEHNRLMVSSLHLTDTWLSEIYVRAKQFAPEFVHAYSSCAITLARFITESGRPPLKVRAVMLTSEPLPVRWLATLQKAFDADISIHYGLTERTNFAEATVRRGQQALDYRINPIYGHQENYVHPDGRPEIVGTSYWNTVMPLIRYRSGDFGVIANGRLERMEGRDLEYLVTKQGKCVPGLSVEPEMMLWQSVSQLQVYQPKPGKVVFRVIPKPGTTKSDLDAALATFNPLWADYFDMSMTIVDQISTTPTGKTRLVVREGALQEDMQ